MAAAAPSPLVSSVEKTNGAKLSRLLIDGGTTVLRRVFDGFHPPANLAADLTANYVTLYNLKRKKVLHQSQWDKLFPPGGATPDSKTFDITLLFLLLTNICGLSPPPSGWHKPPPSSDTSFEANLARVKLYRNELYGHVTSTGVVTAVFNVKWQQISAVLVALGLNPAEAVRLKAAPREEDYIRAVIEWVKSDEEIKAQLREVLESQQVGRQVQEEDHRTLQDTHKAVEVVQRTQQEEHQKQQKTRQIQEEDHRTLQDTNKAVEDVRQIHQDTHKVVEKVLKTQQEELQKQQEARQIQEEDHRTLQDTHKAVEDVMQIHQDTNQQVKTTLKTQKEVRQTQLEDHETLQINKSTLEDVRQTSTKTQEMLDEVHLTQNKTHETVEGVVKTQEERFKAVEADLHEIKQSVGSLKEERNRESQADEVLRNLAKSEFKGDIEYHVGRFQEGTREWVFNKVQNWLDDRNSQNRVMVISSNAGMGKSVISAVICKRMQEPGRLSGSHFCQHNNARYRNPQLMLQSLACHLCHALPEYKQALVEQLSRNLGKNLNNMGVEELFALLFKEPLSNVSDPGRNMLMVIDGLDESEYQERNELLDVTANHFCKLPCWIRFLCTTRPERNIAEALKQLKPFQLEPNEEENVQDIKLFVEKKMQFLIKPENKGDIVKKLVEKSEGLMLYAYFLVSFMEENMAVLDQGDLDGSLPLAISSVYRLYFKRLENELMKELGVEENDFLNLLCAVAASREPLPIDFVSKVLVPGANSQLARRKVLKAIDSVSSLLPFRDGCLHVIHKSINDWLTDTSCYGKHGFSVDEKEGHSILASLCSDELDNLKKKGVHDAQFSPTEKYALQHGVRHMLQSEDNMRSRSLERCIQTYVIDLELLYAKVCIRGSIAVEDILWLQKQKIFQMLSEDIKELLKTVTVLLRKYFNTITNHPRVLFQTFLNNGGSVLSSVASNLLQSKYPEIPYMEFVHKGTRQSAVQARFECSFHVACFDVSPQLNYMVCECRDESIQLWSLHTSKLVWTRPVVVKKFYLNWHEAYRVSPSFSGVLSFYRSVVFHPTVDVVLPGVLSHVYTFDGNRKPLFPESNCRFTVCSISGDKTKMLTDCPDDAKCIIMWSLENGLEIARTTRDEDVLTFAWSPGGKLLAISNSTGSISIVDALNGFTTLTETVIPEVCGMIKFSPDCRFLVCMREEGVSYIEEKKNIFCLNVTMSELPSCTLHDCKSFVPWEFESHSEAGFLLGDPISTRNQIARYGNLRCDFVLDKQTVLRGCIYHSFIDMLDINELCKTERVEGTLTSIIEIVFSLSGETVYVVCNPVAGPTVTAWDVSSGEPIAQKRIQTGKSNRFVPVKEGVLLTTARGALELWNFDLSKCLRNYPHVYGITKMVAISEERVACEAENKVIIFDTTGGEIVSTIPSYGCLLACNRKYQLVTYSSNSLQLLDGKFTLWKKAFRYYPGDKFSLSEPFFVIFGELTERDYKGCLVVDVLSGKIQHILDEHCNRDITSCKFVSDEECVITTSSLADSTVPYLQLFNVKSGDLLSEIGMEDRLLNISSSLGVCPRKRLLAIEQRGSKHGFKLIKVHLPQDKESWKCKR